ncbi:ArsR/SmtB family transcription factor [Bacillus sp. T33-2]|uniref:ArsR/SmtB family transcription factor n=1 Tax=Bacillus sp. T33-2 TaxID=2054168 RepID=UPI000C78D5F0|nr:metalloregulator ArsR/SmtB family transcription factor [Bacillus sp. T33-2]PLR95070.1 ArsR family transcriptional regulator [Bacillus sp. T33-2]
MQTSKEIELVTAANIFKLSGDSMRLAIVKIVAEQECCVCEFVELFEMSQPAISQHLRKLKDAGIVKESRRGQWIYYSLNNDYPYHSFIQTVINDLPSQKLKLDELESTRRAICCD